VTTTVSPGRPRSLAHARIDDAVEHARQLGRTVLLSHVERLACAPDPIAFLAASSAALGSGTLWQQPATGLAIAGAGAAWEIAATGPGRFGQVAEAIRNLQSGLIRDDGSTFPCLGGFAFAENSDGSPRWRDFPGAKLVIPQVLIQNDGHEALLRVTVEVEPRSSPGDVEQQIDELARRALGWIQAPLSIEASQTDIRAESFPNRTAWESSVATAVALIRQGALDKVVLAREERLLAESPFSPTSTLARLRRFDSTATLFGMQSGDSWFLGASPERLVRLGDNRVDVTCLAGSIGMGHDDEERLQLADQLLGSKKNREEHEIVVRSTMSALVDVCEDVTRLAGTPRVVIARAVQHLETPVSARMSDGGSVLDLVERLHPAGTPGRSVGLTSMGQVSSSWLSAPHSSRVAQPRSLPAVASWRIPSHRLNTKKPA
jgi:isochorismate synthase EntC